MDRVTVLVKEPTHKSESNFDDDEVIFEDDDNSYEKMTAKDIIN